ncbi:MAG: nitroreductase family protein [Candidatus Omnitrophica bacterium]|nr:nitroreductase family protein [Candidatus Omnitrophota bacterium]MDD4012920.1 nitroreductase family protein [Candidatus Omnitrophota bacterium]
MVLFHELAESRRSCRSYSDDPIERKDLEKCVDTALLAPSACNAQPWKFIIVDDPATVKKVASTFPKTPGSLNSFASGARVFAAIVSEKQKFIPWIGGKLSGKNFREMDLGLAAGHFVLEARELGIGTCIIGWFDEKKIKQVLGVPRNRSVRLLISLGYPGNESLNPQPRRLKDKRETVGDNRY